MLLELRHLRDQVVELQGRGTELVLENRSLREQVAQHLANPLALLPVMDDDDQDTDEPLI